MKWVTGLAIPLIIISLFMFMYFSPGAYAQEKVTAPVELEEYFALLEEEVPVTIGLSRPIKKEKVPASITVITAEEIKHLGLRHLTDVINYIVPGAVGDIHRSTRTGLFAFRGITVDNNGKYVFMVDGLNANNLTAWGAFNERYVGLMDDLARIEIIQGTGSTLYGSGAISGIINFITRTGKNFQGDEFTAGYGSWDKVETSFKSGRKKSEDNDSFYYLGYKQAQGSTPKGGAGDGLSESSAAWRYWDHFAPSGKFNANITRGDFSLRMRYVREIHEEPYFASERPGGIPYYPRHSDCYRFQNYLFVEPEIRREINENSRIKVNLAFGMDETGLRKIDDWRVDGTRGIHAGDKPDH